LLNALGQRFGFLFEFKHGFSNIRRFVSSGLQEDLAIAIYALAGAVVGRVIIQFGFVRRVLGDANCGSKFLFDKWIGVYSGYLLKGRVV
jgi:hypothetical protein